MILGDIIGINTCGGPLGFRMMLPAVTWFNLLIPGTITYPLIPGVTAIRKWWQSCAFIVYVGLYVRALRADVVGPSEILPILVLLSVLTPFDLVIFNASRGEHYIYALACCVFPWDQALFGLRMCQGALWFWAGFSKIGPWMKYVNAMMIPNSAVTQFANIFFPVTKLLYKDLSKDLKLSMFNKALTAFGVAMEIAVCPMCWFAPKLGVPLAVIFHLYILLMMPFASVQEWNVVCIYMAVSLFGIDFDGYPAAPIPSLNPLLVLLCVFCLFAVPLYGNLFPKEVPFLIAMRPYAGNWRFTWHIVSKKAQEKFRKLTTLDSIFFEENAKLLWGGNPHFIRQFEEFLLATCLMPHYRPMIPIVEKLCAKNNWGPNDYTYLFQEIFGNAVFGFSLGNGCYYKEPYMRAITKICGFEANECYLAVFEPAHHPFLGREPMCEWKVFDITNPSKKIIHGQMPFSEVEKYEPHELPVSEIEKHSLLESKKDN
mmetsp:Transcript_2118/g.3052  ORF Transcript_2118/g.3052 Transcript_2118/m.3052 type:complete len:485 (+) Transcript_2118:395-1849(+)